MALPFLFPPPEGFSALEGKPREVRGPGLSPVLGHLMQPVFSQNRVHQAFQAKSPVQEPSLASAFSPWWWGRSKPSVPAPAPVGVIPAPP